MTNKTDPVPSKELVSEKLSVDGALDMAARCRYLDNGPVSYDRTLYGAVWALADEVKRLRAAHETSEPPASAEGCTTCGGTGWIGCECPVCTPEKAAAPHKPWCASINPDPCNCADKNLPECWSCGGFAGAGTAHQCKVCNGSGKAAPKASACTYPTCGCPGTEGCRLQKNGNPAQ